MWESEYEAIGRNIRMLRMSRGMSQGELAKRIDTVQAALSAAELGKCRVSLKRLFQIRDVLGCSIHDFFDDDTKDEKISVEEVVEAMRLVKKMTRQQKKTEKGMV